MYASKTWNLLTGTVTTHKLVIGYQDLANAWALSMKRKILYNYSTKISANKEPTTIWTVSWNFDQLWIPASFWIAPSSFRYNNHDPSPKYFTQVENLYVRRFGVYSSKYTQMRKMAKSPARKIIDYMEEKR